MPEHNKLSASETLIAIFAMIRKNKNDGRLELRPSELHRAMYEQSQKPMFQDILSVFRFDTRDIVPLSEELEYTINSLQLSRYLERSNPRGATYFIPNIVMNYYDNELKNKKIEKNEETTLKLLARQLCPSPN